MSCLHAELVTAVNLAGPHQLYRMKQLTSGQIHTASQNSATPNESVLFSGLRTRAITNSVLYCTYNTQVTKS